MSDFYALPVEALEKNTQDTTVISFGLPEALKDLFQYTSGQYLTIRTTINGADVRRAYSMCSSPHLGEPLQVAVKRVPGGTMSTYLNEDLRVGQTLEVMPPQGRFVVAPDPERRKVYYMFGAGSGITPLMSMIKTILEEEPQSAVYLLYGNRSEKEVIFKEELARLQKRYAGQLEVEHCFSSKKGVLGWLSNSNYWKGRIDAKKVRKFREAHPAIREEEGYYICGPGDMNQVVSRALMDQGVDEQNIHTEYFSSSDLPHEEDTGGGNAPTQLTVELEGQMIETELPPGTTVLDHLIELGYDPPYSCTSGSCSTCVAKVLKGAVRMEVCLALDKEEIEEGYILTCQSHPTTAELKITYEV